MSAIPVKAIIFDFDGVLAESVSVKGEAFYQLYEHAGPEIQQKVLDYHLAHGGVSRFEKIRHFEKEFLGREISEREMLEIAHRFGELVEEKVVESDWVAGAQEFLEEAHLKELPMFVVSATPEEELERILLQRDMSHYFEGIFGSPTTKDVHLKHILSGYDFDAQQVVMIGDTMSDYNAAQVAGTHFIGRDAPGSETKFPKGVVVMKDLKELGSLVEFS